MSPIAPNTVSNPANPTNQRPYRPRPSFHALLDALFGKRVAFSVFFRIWFAVVLVIAMASGLTLYQLQKTIRPSAQRVVEDMLVDSAKLLAQMLAPYTQEDFTAATVQARFAPALAKPLAVAPSINEETPLWFDQKTASQLLVYVTDATGNVLYDSTGQATGQDYSRWNDVYLTLRGKYGARATRSDPKDEQTSIMYVAAPIYAHDGTLVGVVSVGKPSRTLLPYLTFSRQQLLQTILMVTLFGMVLAALVAAWLRHSVAQVSRYTAELARTPPPHFYLGKELNDLTTAIGDMKHRIENKAYVTEYVHTLTHELKSPLTAIRASGELLGDDLPAADRVLFSQTILQQSDKLQHLIERLLLLAKLEQPTSRLNRETLDVSHLLQVCLSAQQAWILQKNLHYQTFVATNATLKADPFWLQQALQNAIDNAIKYAQSRFTVGVWRSLAGLHIWLINDNPQLPDYVLNRAFERYFSYQSLTDSVPTQPSSTGLGLTLIRQVIELHGGTATLRQLTLAELQTYLENSDAITVNSTTDSTAQDFKNWLMACASEVHQHSSPLFYVLLEVTLPVT